MNPATHKGYLKFSEKSALGMRDVPENGLPFEATLKDGKIAILAPAYSTVYVSSGLGRTLIHNGGYWAGSGVHAKKMESLEFTVPLSSTVFIEAQGKKWRVRLDQDFSSHIGREIMTLLRDKYFRIAVLAHLAVFAVLFALARNPDFSQMLDASPGDSAKAAADGEPEGAFTPVEGADPVAAPFSGISYTQWRQNQQLAATPKDAADQLMQSLSGVKMPTAITPSASGSAILGSGSGGSKARPKTFLSYMRGAEGGGGGGGGGPSVDSKESVTEQVSKQQFKASAKAETAKKSNIDDKDKAMLREKFKEIQRDAKAVYSRALVKDPALSVTVAFEAKVLPTGYLSLTSFRPRGTYKSNSISELRSGMSDVLSQVFVGQKLAGVVLRGENVFVR